MLTSLALHGGGRGADVDRIRTVNAWSTGGLLPDLSLVVPPAATANDRPARCAPAPTHDVDADAIAATLLEAADADPGRYVLCPPDVPDTLPAEVAERLGRLIDYRRLAAIAAAGADRPAPHVTDPIACGRATWRREDTEAVACCVCHREGRPLYDLDPFGVVRCPRCTLVFVSPRLNDRGPAAACTTTSAYFEGDGSVYGDDGRFSPAMFLQRQWMSGRLDARRAPSSAGRSPARGARDRLRVRAVPRRRPPARLRRHRRRAVGRTRPTTRASGSA